MRIVSPVQRLTNSGVGLKLTVSFSTSTVSPLISFIRLWYLEKWNEEEMFRPPSIINVDPIPGFWCLVVGGQDSWVHIICFAYLPSLSSLMSIVTRSVYASHKRQSLGMELRMWTWQSSVIPGILLCPRHCSRMKIAMKSKEASFLLTWVFHSSGE